MARRQRNVLGSYCSNPDGGDSGLDQGRLNKDGEKELEYGH